MTIVMKVLEEVINRLGIEKEITCLFASRICNLGLFNPHSSLRN
jgi:hypothetical protein